MKILLINYEGPWGGAENVFVNYANILAAENYEVEVLVPDNSELHERIKENDLVKVNSCTSKNFFHFLIELITLIRNSNFDLILLNNQKAILCAPIIKFICTSNVIGYEHSPQPNALRSLLLDILILLFIDKYICVSKYMINKRSFIAKSKCVQIYNGFTNKHTFHKNLEPILTFGVTSIFREWKGQKFAIKAFEELNKEGLKAKLIFIGGEDSSNPNYFSNCVEYVKKKNLEEVIEFKGFQENPLEILERDIDVVIQPSITPDPLPTTVIEALMLGKPVIAFNNGGIGEMVKNNYNGFLVDDNNYEILAKKMMKIINNNALISKFGENSFKMFSNYFCANMYKKNLLKEIKLLKRC